MSDAAPPRSMGVWGVVKSLGLGLTEGQTTGAPRFLGPPLRSLGPWSLQVLSLQSLNSPLPFELQRRMNATYSALSKLQPCLAADMCSAGNRASNPCTPPPPQPQ